MLVVETIAKIRRTYFQDGKSIEQICRDLRVSRKTVRKVVRSGTAAFTYERSVQPKPQIQQRQNGVVDAVSVDLDGALAAELRDRPHNATPKPAGVKCTLPQFSEDASFIHILPLRRRQNPAVGAGFHHFGCGGRI